MATQQSLPQVNIQKGMIHLGLGQPSHDLLPKKHLAQAANHALSNNTIPVDDSSFLTYGEEQGNTNFREGLAEFLVNHYPDPVGLDELLITNGNSQALDFICTQFTKPGDTILVEEPSYFLALRIFADHHLNLVGVPVDESGLKIGVLKKILKTVSPAFLYTIPTHHNPAGVTMTEQRRQELITISKKNNLLVVADEVYHFLTFSGGLPIPMGSFCNQAPVICLGSFSKILAPGLRLGWLQAGPVLIKKLTRSGLIVSGGGLNPFTSQIVHSFIQMGMLNDNIQKLNKVYNHRMTVLYEQLKKQLPDTITYQKPEGGYFIWVKFPRGVDTESLRKKAKKQNVDFFPGVMFSHEKGLENYMRLAFCFYDEKQIIQGVKRLWKAIEVFNQGKRI